MRLSETRNVAPSQPGARDSAASKIVGTGEMAELVRKFDWASTPLGAIDSWSKELLAIVNLTLNSPTPARTLWGPDLILVYNDSYRWIPGKRHPDALGKPAREVYREAWHVVGPILERAFESGETFYIDKLPVPIDVGSGIHEFYLDYTYSPVYENGKIAGLFGLLQDVTGEVVATRSLREAETRESRVLKSIGDAVIVTDPEGHIVQMNPVAEQTTGWIVAEAQGRPLGEVFRILDETSREPVESPYDKVRRLGTVVGLANHTILIRRDGTELSIDDSGAPIFDDRGNLTGVVLVFRDIHERRAAERERASIARQLTMVLDATTDGVLMLDREWKMIYRNRRAGETLQASGELTGRYFWETFPATVFEGSPYVEHYSRAMNEGIAGRFEAYYPEPLNAWFSVGVQPAEYGIVIFFRDITLQRAEAEALRDREARLNAIYSTSLEYIGLLSPDGTMLDCNRASLEFAGNTRADVVGKPFADTPWFTGTPGMPDKIRRAVEVARRGETFRSEVALIRPSGETMVFDFSLTPVFDANGNVILLVPEGRDISDVKRTEAALLKSEKLAAVGRLASSIAHEINNPLESVMNLIYLARYGDQAEAQKYLDMADQEIRRVSIIANQTLRFHKQASKPQPTSSADLFSTVMSIYEGRLRNARVRVEKKFRTGQPVVCFQGDVRQVLNNLVANALEAMPFGGRLLIRSRKGRNWKTGSPGLVLTIADNGTGISPAVRKNIFDAFFTTKGTAGNGLGLWVCQEIVARHRGALRVRSTQRSGRTGTAFTLYLPFEPVTE
jgi:PAS domain S-box-containing protein